MVICGEFQTDTGLDLNMATPRIDFIEFEFPKLPKKFMPEDLIDNENVIVSMFWDESEWDYDPETGEGSFRCKGVALNDVYADGHIGLFKNCIMDTIQAFHPMMKKFKLTDLELLDRDYKTYEFPKSKLKPRFLEIVLE